MYFLWVRVGVTPPSPFSSVAQHTGHYLLISCCTTVWRAQPLGQHNNRFAQQNAARLVARSGTRDFGCATFFAAGETPTLEALFVQLAGVEHCLEATCSIRHT